MSKVNSIDLISKQEVLDADPKTIQYYFTGNLDHAGNARILFVFGEVKKNRSLTGDIKSYVLDVPNDNW